MVSVNASNPYLSLLRQPFDTASFGCKLPDPFSPYTSAYRIHSEFKVSSPAGSTTAAYLIRPNPFQSIIDVQALSGGSSTSAGNSGWTQYTTNSIYASTTPAALATILTNYRVVSHGIRIRLMEQQQVATGRMIVARAPRSRPDMSYAALSPLTLNWTAVSAAGNTLLGAVPGVVANSPFLLETMEAKEYSLYDLMGLDLVQVNTVSSPLAFTFSPVVTTTALTASGLNQLAEVTDATINLTSGAIQVNPAITDNSAGWDDFYLYFDGLPNGAYPVVNIEYILHLEGVPQLASTSVITAIPSHPPSKKTDWLGHDSILKASFMTAKTLFTNAPTAYNNIFPGRNLRKDAAAVGGMMLQAAPMLL